MTATSGVAVSIIRRFDEIGRAGTPLVGGKAANLGEMTKAGLPVPPGFVGGKDIRVAVRSSATAEDTPRFSFAGMFESFLNVGLAELPESIKACWASTFGARVLFYRMKQGLQADMPVAVIVQRGWFAGASTRSQ